MKISSLTSQQLNGVCKRVSDGKTVYLMLVCIYSDEEGSFTSFFYAYDGIGNIEKYRREELKVV